MWLRFVHTSDWGYDWYMSWIGSVGDHPKALFNLNWSVSTGSHPPNAGSTNNHEHFSLMEISPCNFYESGEIRWTILSTTPQPHRSIATANSTLVYKKIILQTDKIFTARVRSARTSFHRCASVLGRGGDWGEGTPCPLFPGLSCRGGGTPGPFRRGVASSPATGPVQSSVGGGGAQSGPRTEVPPTPDRTRTGVPSLLSPDSTRHGQDTPQSVRLLWSSRRTYFLKWLSTWKYIVKYFINAVKLPTVLPMLNLDYSVVFHWKLNGDGVVIYRNSKLYFI